MGGRSFIISPASRDPTQKLSSAPIIGDTPRVSYRGIVRSGVNGIVSNAEGAGFRGPNVCLILPVTGNAVGGLAGSMRRARRMRVESCSYHLLRNGILNKLSRSILERSLCNRTPTKDSDALVIPPATMCFRSWTS